MATTLYHPTIPNVTQEVDENVDAWVEQGWKKTEPKAVKDAREASEAETAQ